MKLFMTGATGYIGQPLVNACCQDGHSVTVWQRPGSTRTWAPSNAAIQCVTGDLLDTVGMAQAMAGADAVIHLVGIIREHPRGGVTFRRVQVEGTQSVLDAAKAAGVQRLLHMSALGAKPHAVADYHQAKWFAEELVRGSGLTYTIVQPSVVFGRGGPGPNFIQQLSDLVRRTPVCPVIGDGQFLLQPVAVRTVVDVFRQALAAPWTHGQTYEVGGPEVLSYMEILRRIATAQNKRLVAAQVPLPAMEWLTARFGRMSWFPVTMDQLTMLKEGNVCNDSETVYRHFATPRIPFCV